jgi:hypothetical protein
MIGAKSLPKLTTLGTTWSAIILDVASI